MCDALCAEKVISCVLVIWLQLDSSISVSRSGPLRRLHPKVKMKMVDLTPGEVISALRRGEIDLALTYLGMDLLSRDFYMCKIDNVPSVAVLPIDHRLASQKQIRISQLKNERFLQVADTCAPGYNQRVSQLCRRFGKFRPRFAPVRAFESIAESLAISGNEDAISLNPMFVRHLKIPNVAIVPIADKGATWELFVAWQRGKTAAPVSVLIDVVVNLVLLLEPSRTFSVRIFLHVLRGVAV